MWTAHLYRVRTGDIGPRLNFESATWSMSLNEIEEIKFRLRKSDLPRVDLNYWLAPWWSGVVYMWNNTPIIAGPIISRPYETYDKVDIACTGIRSILARRFIIGELANWAELPKSSITYSGMSLGTIAQQVVKQAQQKPGGNLPITFPIAPEYVSTFASLKSTLPACKYEDGSVGTAPDGSTIYQDCFWDASVQGNKMGKSFAVINGKPVYDTSDAGHTRTYKGFNLDNISADDILTKLSNVIDGPDIMFRPKKLDDASLVHEMLHGTEDQPRIAQTITPTWDITPENSSVSDIQVTMTGTYQTSRVYSLGAGQDTKRLIKVASNLDGVSKGFPLLETVHNAGNSENPTVVANHAVSALKANTNMLQEIQFDVRADGPLPITEYYPGMVVNLVVKDMLSLKDGIHKAILLNMNGSSDKENTVGLSLQSLERYMIEDKTKVDDDAV